MFGLIVTMALVAVSAGARNDARDRRVAVAAKAIDRLRREVGRSTATTEALRGQISRIDGDLAAVEEGVGPAEARLKTEQRALDRRVDAAHELVVTGDTALTPAETFEDLAAPLETVSEAIHANDELAVDVLAQQGDLRTQESVLRGLRANVQQARFQIAAQERAVRDQLSETTQALHRLGSGEEVDALRREAASVLEEARTHLHELGIAEVQLREMESGILAASTKLTEREEHLRGKLVEVKQAVKALYEDMAAVEAIVGLRMQDWVGPIDGSAPPVVEGVLGVCPVDEPNAYTDDWGAPRWAGGFHLHQGNDIFAPEGTPIRAPFDGIAIRVDNTLGGIAVKVYGEAGYVYNAHLSEVVTLGEVTAGTIIGLVGNTGDAIHSPPHDHFEWHPGNGDAVDPYPYLNAVC